jgi:hypothetical protein
VASQMNVANTLALAFSPMLLPRPRSKPRPLTLMLPSVSTSARRLRMIQI